MATLIFSDTHLTHHFDQRKFDFLKKLIESADQVVINGDFWDYYLSDWEAFLNSKWSELFPLLKDRSTIYLYGNHDQEYHSDLRASLFSTFQGHNYQLNLNGKKLNIEHGHLIAKPIEVIFPICDNKFIQKLGNVGEVVGTKLLGSKFPRFNSKANELIK